MFKAKQIAVAVAATIFSGGAAAGGELADLTAKMNRLLQANAEMARQNAEMARQIAELQGKVSKVERDAGNVAKTFKVVTAGDEEGTFKLPGSETSVGFYGAVHVDAYVDTKGRQSGDWASDIGSQPVAGVNVSGNDARKGKSNITARTSRLGFKSSTPTEAGMLRTTLEADFNKNPSGSDGVLNNTLVSNSFSFRLRHAFGELDDDWGKLLAGQTWSTFMNLDALPETVDFNGHGSGAFVRQPMIRYTAKLGDAGNLALALENPHGALDGGAAQAAPYIDKRPDLVANWSIARPWGMLSAQALSTEYRYDDGSRSAKANGHGFGLGGAFKLGAQDNLLFQFTGGKGLGRYLPATSWHIASYDAERNRVRLYRSDSWMFGWGHAWSERMRTNLAWGTTRIKDNWDSDFSDGYIDSKRMSEGFANVIFGVAKNMEVGLELSFGNRHTYAWTSGTGATGEEYSGKRSRVQTSFNYSF